MSSQNKDQKVTYYSKEYSGIEVKVLVYEESPYMDAEILKDLVTAIEGSAFGVIPWKKKSLSDPTGEVNSSLKDRNGKNE